MNFSSNLEVGTGRGDNLVDHRLGAEQPDEEVDGEEGKVEGEEEQHLEQEGTHGDEDAGGADVEVENKTQPGVVGVVGGEAEEEGDGEHQEERHHQELHQQHAVLHQ